jgi:hypothetical protein
MARWQFYNNTHPPFYCSSLIIFSAFGPCPCPREIDWKRLLIPCSSAKRLKSATGSEPADKTKINGVSIAESR